MNHISDRYRMTGGRFAGTFGTSGIDGYRHAYLRALPPVVLGTAWITFWLRACTQAATDRGRQGARAFRAAASRTTPAPLPSCCRRHDCADISFRQRYRTRKRHGALVASATAPGRGTTPRTSHLLSIYRSAPGHSPAWRSSDARTRHCRRSWRKEQNAVRGMAAPASLAAAASLATLLSISAANMRHRASAALHCRCWHHTYRLRSAIINAAFTSCCAALYAAPSFHCAAAAALARTTLPHSTRGKGFALPSRAHLLSSLNASAAPLTTPAPCMGITPRRLRRRSPPSLRAYAASLPRILLLQTFSRQRNGSAWHHAASSCCVASQARRSTRRRTRRINVAQQWYIYGRRHLQVAYASYLPYLSFCWRARSYWHMFMTGRWSNRTIVLKHPAK